MIVTKIYTSDKIDFTTFTGNGIVRLGTKKIMWGVKTINASSGTDTTATVAFDESFNSTPSVVATCGTWVGQPKVFVYNISTSQFKVGINHSQGSTVSCDIQWMAIG